MKRVEKCRKLMDYLIEKSFHNLKNKRIFLIELDIFNYSASTINFPFFALISLCGRSREYSEDSLKGLLAHELSHLSIIKDMGFFEKVSFSLKWIFSKNVKADFERRADLLVIEKGYGKCLFKLKQERFKGEDKAYIERVSRKGYLLPEEVKQYMKKLK